MITGWVEDYSSPSVEKMQKVVLLAMLNIARTFKVVT